MTDDQQPETRPRRRDREKLDPEAIWQQWTKGLEYKGGINLFDTVQANEDFYVGKQWEGVDSQGLPTPVLNIIKRVILYQVATTATDNVKLAASPLPMARRPRLRYPLDYICKVVSAQFDVLWEINKMSQKTRQMMKDAAVDSDSCLFSWFDPDFDTGQNARGIITTEVLDNTRVCFGDPNEHDPQAQPYILIGRRRMTEDVRDEAEDNGQNPDGIVPDDDETMARFSDMVDGKTTEILKLYRSKQTRTIWAKKVTKEATVREEWDTGLKLYPIVWFSWERVKNSYHGQAAVTGLIPNQLYINKQAALEMVSAMNDSFQKVLHDKTRIPVWDSRIGRSIGVTGPVTDAWAVVPPAPNSGKGDAIMHTIIDYTKEFCGATDAATGVGRPDNATAILAMQKASQVPTELTIQDRNQCVEDQGRIWADMMRVYYGQRYVEAIGPEDLEDGTDLSGIPAPEEDGMQLFDFGVLEDAHLLIQLDVGSSAYWSQIAQAQNLSSLLLNGFITLEEYLEQAPDDTVPKKAELLASVRARMEPPAPAASYTDTVPTGDVVPPDLAAPPPPDMPLPPVPAPMPPEMAAPPPPPTGGLPPELANLPPEALVAILAQLQGAAPAAPAMM